MYGLKNIKTFFKPKLYKKKNTFQITQFTN